METTNHGISKEPDTWLVLKIGAMAYHVPADTIDPWLEVLKGVVALDRGDGVGVERDDQAVELRGCTVEEFECFKLVVEGSRFAPLSKDQWVSVLHVSTVWQQVQVREIATEHLSRYIDHPFDLVRLGIQHRVKRWLLDGLRELSRPGKYTDVDLLGNALGWKTAAKIAEAARITSALAKHNPFVVPRTTVVCASCRTSNKDPIPANRMTYSISPRLKSAGEELLTIPATVVASWNPLIPKPLPAGTPWCLKKPNTGITGWSCGQCTASGSSDRTVPMPHIVLSELVPPRAVDNTDILMTIFADEFKEAF